MGKMCSKAVKPCCRMKKLTEVIDLFARKLVFSVLALVLTAGLSAQELKVAAASDLSAAMQKLAPAYTRQTGVELKFVYGSSGNFFTEIRNGAQQYDVFLSADRSYPETLEGTGKGEGTSLYARGKLVLWVPNRLGIEPTSDMVKILMSQGVKKIAIANPEHAPYGRAAVASMAHFKIYDQLNSKLVLGESVSQAAQIAQTGYSDVGLIALSLALSETMQKNGRYVLVPTDSYPYLDQAALVLRSTQNKQQARRFVEFLQSAAAQKILSEYGFEPRGLEAKK